jgi:hypothetical protein
MTSLTRRPDGRPVMCVRSLNPLGSPPDEQRAYPPKPTFVAVNRSETSQGESDAMFGVRMPAREEVPPGSVHVEGTDTP